MQITMQIFKFFEKQIVFFEIVFNTRSRNSSLSKCNFVHWPRGYSISWQRDMRCRRENEYRYDMSSESSRFPLHAVSSLPLRHLSPTPPHRCFPSFFIMHNHRSFSLSTISVVLPLLQTFFTPRSSFVHCNFYWLTVKYS